jgi:hypothetical protein
MKNNATSVSYTQKLTGIANYLTGMKHEVTDCRGRVIRTPALYSVGPGFKSRLGDRLSWLRFVVFVSVPPGKRQDNTFNYATVASSATFPIHYSLISLSADAM